MFFCFFFFTFAFLFFAKTKTKQNNMCLFVYFQVGILNDGNEEKIKYLNDGWQIVIFLFFLFFLKTNTAKNKWWFFCVYFPKFLGMVWQEKRHPKSNFNRRIQRYGKSQFIFGFIFVFLFYELISFVLGFFFIFIFKKETYNY